MSIKSLYNYNGADIRCDLFAVTKFLVTSDKEGGKCGPSVCHTPAMYRDGLTYHHKSGCGISKISERYWYRFTGLVWLCGNLR